MNACSKTGCRNLKLQCQDCLRIVSTAKIEEDQWRDVESDPPEDLEPCEFTIQVKCKGWYRPKDGIALFVPSQVEPPVSKFCKWRHWDEGENKNE